MKKSTHCIAVLAAALTACAPTVLPPSDVVGDTATDRAAPPDARGDSGITQDVADSAVPDATVEDATVSDSGVDAQSPVDSGVDSAVSDSGVTVDTGVTIDSGVSTDSGVGPDGSSVDDGSAPDASADSASSEAGVDGATDSAADAGAEGGADAAADGGADGSTSMGDYAIVRNTTGATCDTSSAWTDTGLADDDEAMSAPAPLPFALSYFGQAATHFSANTNGLVQLWPSASGTPSTAFENVALPDSSGPAGAVAVFWDDLFVPIGASVRYATFGTAPNRRFVIEYNDVDTIDAEQFLQFQAKFFEGTNVIEFHYCSMVSIGLDDRHTGESATIGAQNFNGSVGSQVAIDTAGTTPSGAWYRLVPR